MNYISTRGGIAPTGFTDAVLTGLAPDGGLILPEEIPDVSSFLDDWKELPFAVLAEEIMSLYTDIPRDALRGMITRSCNAFDHKEITPIVKAGDIHVLELFHGPTLSFKDVALQFLGNLFEYILDQSGGSLNILGATSGDTGSAAIHGARGKQHINIFIMYPDGGTSRTQELQMTTVPDKNVFNIAVEGNFDDCQQILKAIFKDLEFKKKFSLGAVNSINWARILAQTVYYFYGAFRVMETTGTKKVSFAVPTGNFGDIFAGYMARMMGLPVKKFVLATNENNILARFFNTGLYSIGEVHKTISPSMDIQVASNFERYLYYRHGKNPDKLSAMMEEFSATGKLSVAPMEDGRIDDVIVSSSGDTESTLATIREFHAKNDYLLDPHTAVGVHVARGFTEQDVPMICLATAHPAKFGPAIKEAVGEDIAHHPAIDSLESLPARNRVLPADINRVKSYIREMSA